MQYHAGRVILIHTTETQSILDDFQVLYGSMSRRLRDER